MTEKNLEYYEEQIKKAQINNSLSDLALAYEEFALFWLQRDNKKIAKIYLSDALNIYEKLNNKSKISEFYNKYHEILDFNHKDTSYKKTIALKLLENFFENIPTVAIQGYLKDGTITYWNLASEILYGYTKQEAIGKNLLNLIIPTELQEEVKNNIKLALEKDIPIPPSELLLKRKNGERVPVFSCHIIFKLMENEPTLYCIDMDLSENKKIEAKLKESLEKYQLLFNNMLNGFALHEIITDKNNKPIDYKVLEINPAYEKLTGLSRDMLIGKNIKSVLPNLEESWIQDFGEVALTGRPQIIERYVEHLDKYFLVSVFTNKIRYFATVFNDITQIKKTERELTENRELLQLIINSTSDIIVLKDGNGRWVIANDAAIDLFDLYDTDWLYKSDLDLAKIKPQLSNIFLFCHQSDEITWENRKLTRFEEKVKDKYGKDKYYDVIKITIFDENSKRRYLLVVARDITTLKNTMMNLEKSEKKYRLLFEGMRDGLVIGDIDGNIIDCNRAYADMLGYTKEELIGMNYLELTPEEYREWQKNEIFAKNLLVRGYSPIYEKEYIRKDGQRINVEVRAYVNEFIGDRPNRLWAIVRDITELKKTQEMLRQSQKMEAVGQLAGGIAHDFNNILAGIIGYTELSLKLIENNPKIEKNLNQILKASERARHLVNQILSFSRQAKDEKTHIYLKPLIKEVVELLKVSIPSSVIIKTNISKDTHTVFADPIKLHEVIMNLATNAVHAMNEKGELTISLYEKCVLEPLFGVMGAINPDAYSIIEVSDTGCGIDSETMKKIFDPFFTTKPPGKGTGMGLSVVYGIIQSHEGNIQVKSEVGKGTTFRIFLPKSHIKPLENDNEILDETLISGQGNILFVDDEEIIVSLSQEILQSLGYNVIATTNSNEALEIFKKNPEKFDLLITDQTMPYLTGLELSKNVLMIKPNLPIILCTGYSSSVNEEKAKEIGIKKFLMKPTTRKELGMAIKEVLNKNE